MNTDRDEILDELYATRERPSVQFNHDTHQISDHLRDLTEQERRAGRPVLTPPPRSPLLAHPLNKHRTPANSH